MGFSCIRFYSHKNLISIWETIILAEKGRIKLDQNPQVWIKKYLRSLDFKEARITHEITMKSRSIQLDHQEPADRFIAATAIELDLMRSIESSRFVKKLTNITDMVN